MVDEIDKVETGMKAGHQLFNMLEKATAKFLLDEAADLSGEQIVIAINYACAHYMDKHVKACIMSLKNDCKDKEQKATDLLYVIENRMLWLQTINDLYSSSR